VSLERGARSGEKKVGSRDVVRNPKKIKIHQKLKNLQIFFLIIIILVKIWTYYHGFKRAFNRKKWKKFSRSKMSWINCSMSLGI
jgi:hypothetical protein